MNAEHYYEDIEIGDEIDTVERSISLEQVRAFLAIRGGISGPSRFTDDAYARSEGLPGAIVPGAMNSAMMAQLLTGWSSTATLKKNGSGIPAGCAPQSSIGNQGCCHVQACSGQ